MAADIAVDHDGGFLAGGQGGDHGSRTRHHITGGKDARPAGDEGLLVNRQRTPFAQFQILNALGIGLLADGHNQGVQRNLEFRTGDGNRTAAAAGVRLAQLVADKPHTGQLAVFGQNRHRSDQRLNLNAFFQPGLDFLGIGGHFIAGPAIEHGHAFHTFLTEGNAGGVHRGIAAADDADAAFGQGLILQVIRFQELDTRNDAFGILLGQIQLQALMGTHGQEDGLVALFKKLVQGDITAQDGIVFDFHIGIQQGVDFPLEQLTGQTIGGNGADQHPAGLGFPFEDGHFVPGDGQGIGGHQAGGAGADDGDFRGMFIRGLDQLFPGGRVNLFHDETLEGANSNRLTAGYAGPADIFAGMMADAGTYGRQRIGLPDDPVGIIILLAGNMGDIAPDFGADGTAVLAGGAHQLFAGAGRTLPVENVGLIFLAEPVESAEDRIGSGLPQTAQRGGLDGLGQLPQLHHALEPQEGIGVVLPAARAGNGLENLEHPLGALAAGNALPTAFRLDKFHEEFGQIDHAGIFIEDDQPAGTHNSANGLYRLVVNFDIQTVFGDAATGRSADLYAFAAFAIGNSAADIIDHLLEGSSHRDFDQAGTFDHAGEGEDFGAFAGFGAHGTEPIGAAFDNQGQVGQGLDVVDNGRLAEEALNRRERRPGPGHTAFAFDTVQQGGFFAADKGAGSHFENDVEVVAAVENVMAQQAVGTGLFDGVLEPLDGQGILGTNINVGLGGADAVGGDYHAFDETVGIAFADSPVHKRARITFIGVADQVFLIRHFLEGEFPLFPGGETTAAAAPQAAGFDQIA
ncbi:MAG: hypothetical protein BWY71_01708 [Planctomycetes bacterium ADurb.Bin412]|nr:MAG: hypothetical protein BWY71_01708 [Planctomycetes bacterium ADurb.Bin412]